jgi:hypothetical protein
MPEPLSAYGTIIGLVRHNPSTVVVLAGEPSEGLLRAIDRSMNVSLVRPDGADSPAQTARSTAQTPRSAAEASRSAAEALRSAAGALRRAAGISSPYALVAADPLTAVATEWEAQWEVQWEVQWAGEAHGGDAFELRAGEALAAWRANQFELPDYYLVLAGETAPDERHASFYLGPLRAVRPHRVAVVAAAEPAEQAAEVLTALASLRHGPWWPPLEDVVAAARTFYPGALAGSPEAGQARLLA